MKPRGPVLDNRRYTKRPTTTGGSPMNVFRRLMIRPLPGNLFRPINAPAGRPAKVDIMSAIKETFIDRKMMFRRSLSSDKIREKAFTKPSVNRFISDCCPQ